MQGGVLTKRGMGVGIAPLNINETYSYLKQGN